MLKTNAQLKGLHELRTLAGIGKGSIPNFASPTKAIVNLQMLKARKNRFLQEETRARRRIDQIKILLEELEKEREELLKVATTQIAKFRADAQKKKEESEEEPEKRAPKTKKKGERTVLSY